MKPKIGILNSGGDCAGLNAVISAIVRSGYRDFDFVGINRGLEGLVEPNSEIALTRESVRGIAHIGGTILVTTNHGLMGGKTGTGEVKVLPDELVQKAMNKYHELGLSALIVIGGDGSLTSALQLAKAGMNIVGVPKTIDNDLQATERTFGFESAVEMVTEALDRIHTTARSHQRIMIVEVMGRNSGWIALHGGIAGNSDAIILPEMPFSYDSIVNLIKEREARGRKETVIVVAEGAKSQDGEVIYQDKSNTKGEFRLGGIAEQISKYLDANLPEYENRYLVLGHLQRGGSPTSDDRVLAFMYGAYALQMVKDGKFGQMVSWNGHQLSSVDIESAVHSVKKVTPNHPLVQLAKKAEISFCE